MPPKVENPITLGMKKLVLIFLAFVVILGISFFLLSKREKEVIDVPKQTEQVHKPQKKAEPDTKNIESLRKFAKELAKPVPESKKIEKAPKAPEAAKTKPKKQPKEMQEMQRDLLKATKARVKKTIRIARKICSKDAAKALEHTSNCTLKIFESSGFSMDSFGELNKCAEKHGANKQSNRDCGLDVQVEIAKEYCTPEEVDILSAYSKCVSDGTPPGKINSDIKAAMEISHKCMRDYPITGLSPKCSMGMAGMN